MVLFSVSTFQARNIPVVVKEGNGTDHPGSAGSSVLSIQKHSAMKNGDHRHFQTLSEKVFLGYTGYGDGENRVSRLGYL